ncbi:MAG: NUDIX domain-containing protein [Candidatus Diapherotrites archaeon]|nr:NUDIX domain-containing protein [Candidatus Diapherotrites archaeon]
MKCASLIVRYKDEYLLQLRDDNPNISFPGTWGLFGGQIECSETPEEAIFREFKEETGIEIDTFHFYKRMEFSDSEEFLFYVVDYIPLEKIKLFEGQKAVYVPRDKLRELNFCFHDGETLNDFDANFLKASATMPLNKGSRRNALFFGDTISDSNHFGVEKMPVEAETLFRDFYLVRRGMFIGQRGFNEIIESLMGKRQVEAAIGLAASGGFQLGNKADVEILKFLKSCGIPAKVWILDIDGYIDRKRVDSLDRSRSFTNNYVKWLKKLGLGDEDIIIQSQKDIDYFIDAFCLAKKLTLNKFNNTYGHFDLGFIFSSLLMYSMFFSYAKSDKKVIGIGGIEEDDHARIIRDLLRKVTSKSVIPSFLYFRHEQNLMEGKGRLSSANPESTIFFDDSEDIIIKKINDSFTCKNNISNCKVFEFYKYNEPNDNVLEKIYEKCVSGEVNCGWCKNKMAGIILNIVNS